MYIIYIQRIQIIKLINNNFKIRFWRPLGKKALPLCCWVLLADVNKIQPHLQSQRSIKKSETELNGISEVNAELHWQWKRTCK